MSASLKYTVIKSRDQYNEYCRKLEDLASQPSHMDDEAIQQEVELLTVLIEKWDAQNTPQPDVDPVELLKILMKEHRLKAKDLVQILGVSKGLVSSILNYKKGMSKTIIRILAAHFKVSQEAFNRPYSLVKSKPEPKPYPNPLSMDRFNLALNEPETEYGKSDPEEDDKDDTSQHPKHTSK